MSGGKGEQVYGDGLIGKAKNLAGPALRTFDVESWNIGEWKKG